LKNNKFLNALILIFLGLVVIIALLSNYYELCSTKITILSLCGYILCLNLVLLIVKFIILRKKGFAILSTTGLLFLLYCVSIVNNDIINIKASYNVFSTDKYSVIVRLNESFISGRCDIYIKENNIIMKKIGYPLGIPKEYDPIASNNYEIDDNISSIILKIKCDPDRDEYETIEIQRHN